MLLEQIATIENELIKKAVIAQNLLTVREMLTPQRVIKNGPASIFFWPDGSKTVIKRKKGDKDSAYNAFCAALAIKIYGSNSKVQKVVQVSQKKKA